MKRFVYAVCIILIALVLWVGFGQNSDRNSMSTPGGMSVSEATFALRTSDAQEDVTDYLVGRFSAADGSIYFFDGKGCVKRTAANLSAEIGGYCLTQSEDGSAVLQIRFGESRQLYSFRITGPDGSFALTDDSGVSTGFTPQP